MVVSRKYSITGVAGPGYPVKRSSWARNRVSWLVGIVWTLVIGVVAWPHAFASVSGGIVVVPVRTDGAYGQLIDSLRSTLEQAGVDAPSVTVIPLSAFQAGVVESGNGPKPRLVVTVGTRAARQIAKVDLPVPVFSILVPRLSYKTMVEGVAGAAPEDEGRSRSAIYLDQPPTRKLDLIRIVLPRKKRIGVILGPGSAYLEDQLRSIAVAKNLHIQIETMQKGDRLISSLNNVLAESDVFLALADAAVSNRHTVQNLLLTTYRQGVPVVAYSRAYVKAGALMAVYSTPAQFGQQAGEIILQMVQNGSWSLPAPQYPDRFSVVINQRVARSLGIAVESAPEIERRLRLLDGGRS